MGRNTRFKNRTDRAILIQAFRSSVNRETMATEIIIASQNQHWVNASEFSYENNNPDIHGILRVRFVGEEENPAFITARHVELSGHIFFDKDKNG